MSAEQIKVSNKADFYLFSRHYITIANYFNVSLDQIFQDSLHVKKNVITDNVILKMNYMDDEEQKLVLKLIESVEDYVQRGK